MKWSITRNDSRLDAYTQQKRFTLSLHKQSDGFVFERMDMICFITIRLKYSRSCTPLLCRFSFHAPLITQNRLEKFLALLFDLWILEWICFHMSTQQSKDVVDW